MNSIPRASGDAKYKQLQNLFEEKKKKLAEIKAKNQALLTDVNTHSEYSASVKTLEDTGSSWNDIVSAIESIQVSSISKRNSVYLSKISGEEANGAKKEQVIAKKKLHAEFQICLQLSKLEITPNPPVECYQRGVQTSTRSIGLSNDLSENESADDLSRQTGAIVDEELVSTIPNSDNNQILWQKNSDNNQILRQKNSDNNYQPQTESEEDLAAFSNSIHKGKPRFEVQIFSKEDVNIHLQQNPEFEQFINNTSKFLDRAMYLGEKYDLLEGSYDLVKSNQNNIQNTIKKTTELSNSVECRSFSLNGDWINTNQNIYDIDWNPFEHHKVISAIHDHEKTSGSTIVEWNLDYDGQIETRLINPSSKVTAARYWTSPDTTYNTSPGGGYLILGGSYNGQILLWDTRTSQKNPILIVSNNNLSQLDYGKSPHKCPIYSIQIVDNLHFASVDTNGIMAVWNIYKLQHPVEKLDLTWIKSSPLNNNNNNNALNFDSLQNNEVTVTGVTFKNGNHFYIGSADGCIYSGQRHGERKGLLKQFKYHNATISSIKIHPARISPPQVVFQSASTESSSSLISESSSENSLYRYNINDLVLTSSLDWSVCLWNPKLNSRPLAVFSEFSDYVMDVSWSKHHPAMFSAVDSSGSLSIWNINADDIEFPLLISKAAGNALNKIQWSPHQADLLVASSYSNKLCVYKVDSECVRPANDEWNKLEQKVAKLNNLTQQNLNYD